MKARLIFLVLLAMWTASYADFIDTPTDSTDAIKNIIPVNLGRHHIGVGIIGYFNANSGDFELPEYGFDGSNGNSIFMNYRYSITSDIDVLFDVRGWVSEASSQGINVTTTVMGGGPGVRYTINSVSKYVFPYVQVSGLSMSESVAASSGIYSLTVNSDEVFGFAVTGGAELRLGKLISIPVEAMYLYGEPADDVSGFGFTTGITFNWGKIE